MVLDPPQQPVNIKRIIIYSFIPILGAYAAWRIQKFWALFGLNIGIGLMAELLSGIAAALFSPWVGIAVSLGISIPLSVYLIRNYAIEYNKKIAASSAQTETNLGEK